MHPKANFVCVIICEGNKGNISMNIWIINHYAMPPQYEVRVRNNMMAKYLQRKGYSVQIIAASTMHNKGVNLIEERNIPFCEQRYDDLSFVHVRTSNYNGNGISRIINMIQFPFRTYRTAKSLENKPDVVISSQGSVFGIGAYLVAKKNNAIFIREVRDLWPDTIVAYTRISKYNPIIGFLNAWQKWIYKRADAIVFSMEGGKEYIKDKKWDKAVQESKIHHISNGVDLETFNYHKINTVTIDCDLTKPNTFKVVYTGSIRLANNLRKIIDIAINIKERSADGIVFLIYGDGPDRTILEQYCLDNDIDNVIFKGHVDKTKIPYILSKCDLNIMHFKQSILKKYGSSMNKMFDYLASGKPSLTDCEFGYDTFNRYKAGWSLDGADAETMAEKIIEIANMPRGEYEKYCENALRAAKDYDYEVLANKLETVVLNLYGQAGS